MHLHSHNQESTANQHLQQQVRAWVPQHTTWCRPLPLMMKNAGLFLLKPIFTQTKLSCSTTWSSLSGKALPRTTRSTIITAELPRQSVAIPTSVMTGSSLCITCIGREAKEFKVRTRCTHFTIMKIHTHTKYAQLVANHVDFLCILRLSWRRS